MGDSFLAAFSKQLEVEREKVRVLREALDAFLQTQKAHYGDAIGLHIAMIKLAHDAAQALATTEPEEL